MVPLATLMQTEWICHYVNDICREMFIFSQNGTPIVGCNSVYKLLNRRVDETKIANSYVEWIRFQQVSITRNFTDNMRSAAKL